MEIENTVDLTAFMNRHFPTTSNTTQLLGRVRAFTTEARPNHQTDEVICLFDKHPFRDDSYICALRQLCLQISTLPRRVITIDETTAKTIKRQLTIA